MARLKTYLQKNRVEAGCDEAGRGCLAGPVFAAAVILPRRWNHPLLNDSKKLTHRQRQIVQEDIERRVKFWAVASVSEKEIDEINILNASFLAMHRALEGLSCIPEALLIDGNRFTAYKDVPHECIVKGDEKFRCIAAASILAKTHRDAYMLDLHKSCTQYGWAYNKGYPTKMHREAIRMHGAHVFHRRSFSLLGKPKLETI